MGNLLYVPHTKNIITASYKFNFNTFFKIRVICTCLLVCLIIWNCIIHPDEFYRFFTLWGLMLTTIYYILLLISYLMGRNYTKTEYEALQAQNHFKYNQLLVVLFQTVWAAEFVITSVFWCILLPVLGVYSHNNPDYNHSVTTMDLVFDAFVHSIPFISLVLDLLLTSIVFTPAQIAWPYILGGCFAVMDCCIVLTGHPPAYPVVMTWKSYLTAITLVGFALLLSLGFYAGYRATLKNAVTKDDLMVDYFLIPDKNTKLDDTSNSTIN